MYNQYYLLLYSDVSFYKNECQTQIYLYLLQQSLPLYEADNPDQCEENSVQVPDGLAKENRIFADLQEDIESFTTQCDDRFVEATNTCLRVSII